MSHISEVDLHHSLWLMWGAPGQRYSVLCMLDCEGLSDDPNPVRREVCTLFAGHHGPHSWAVGHSVVLNMTDSALPERALLTTDPADGPSTIPPRPPRGRFHHGKGT